MGLQKGATMVEFALILLVFMMLVFGIIEITLAVAHWQKVVKAAREGVRYAIVNEPVCNVFYGGTLSPACDSGMLTDSSGSCTAGNSTSLSLDDCASATCTALANRINAYGWPAVTPEKITVTYTCTGELELPSGRPIPSVTVSISNVPHDIFLLNAINVTKQWVIPDISVTKTAEDLATPGP